MGKFSNLNLTNCSKREVKIDIKSRINIILLPLFISSSIKDLFENVFDLCREYQEKITSNQITEVSGDYEDRLHRLC